MDKKSAASVLDRLQIALGVQNDSQLCEATNTRRATLGNWRSRNSVPYPLCVQIAEERDLSLDWLLTGDGAMFRNGNSPAHSNGDALDPRGKAVMDLFLSLDEAGRREIQSAAEEKKRIRDIEQRLKDLTEALADAKRPA